MILFALSNEAYVQNKIRLAVGSGNVRLFRNNTGALLDLQGRLVKFGLCKGSSDLIGFRSITITQDMVGQQLAVFSAIEVKDKGKATNDQKKFIDIIQKAGGMAGVARDVQDAKNILNLD
mgnify:FL=1|tara:strand:+ start:461 stop:820 length:360 start_codon:yes stop_codon:yes gene_type:complete